METTRWTILWSDLFLFNVIHYINFIQLSALQNEDIMGDLINIVNDLVKVKTMFCNWQQQKFNQKNVIGILK